MQIEKWHPTNCETATCDLARNEIENDEIANCELARRNAIRNEHHRKTMEKPINARIPPNPFRANEFHQTLQPNYL